ncbi:MAG: ATP-binding protein [Acidobacteriaceae bacterium]
MVEKALAARRESKYIEFKQGFDCDSKGEWCEVVKDLVAMSNSGGGIVVFGLTSTGEPVDTDLSKIATLDPADVSNKVGSYTGSSDFEFSIVDLEKGGRKLVAFLVGAAATPYVFERHGGYADSSGKPKSAFPVGAIYFRHGAKSEPATNDDIRRAISRRIEAIRKEWLAGVRKVVEAPAGSTIMVSGEGALPKGGFRIDGAPSSTPVHLTRNRAEATGTILYEEVSATLFGEINNVIESNRILFPGQGKFLLGSAAYYRVYAERKQVEQPTTEIEKLLSTAISEYSPLFYWQRRLSSEVFASYLVDIYLWPKGNEVFILLRAAMLLGEAFCRLLAARFSQRWGRYSQPPGFYHGFIAQVGSASFAQPCLLAARTGPQGVVEIAGEPPATVEQLLADANLCDALLSKACHRVFMGEGSLRSICRLLDILCHGEGLVSSARAIADAFVEQVGGRLPDEESSGATSVEA